MISKLRGLLRDGEAGTTLAELLVVMALLGLVLTATTTTVIGGMRTAGGASTRVTQSTQATQAMQAMSKSLRTAVLPQQLGGSCTPTCAAAFIQGTSTSVSFYANLNNAGNTIGPSRVTYSLNTATGDLSETIQPPDAHAVGVYSYTWCTPGPGCTTAKTRVIAANVVAPGGATAAVFSYWKSDGTALSTPLDATGLSLVDSIDVAVSVKATKGYLAPATSLVQRVALPNHDTVAQVS